MYNANNYGYNPYGGYMPQRSMQQPIQQPTVNETLAVQPVNNTYKLNGKQVESVDVVKAMDIPMDGSVSYFPIADGSAIVTKQLQMDGTSKTVVYKPTVEDKKELPKYITPDELKSAIKDIDLSDIDDLKEELKELRKEIKDLKKKKKDD